MIDRVIALLGPRPPRRLVRPSARRHVAGPEIVDACRLARTLAGEGKLATIGPLGEDSSSVHEVAVYASECRRALHELSGLGVGAALSVKLSALGLALDEELCFERLSELVRAGAASETTVFIDMERSAAVDSTLGLYRRLREQSLGNAVLALQARLRRTLADVRALAPLEPRISLCKGAYDEPAELVYSNAAELRASFVSILAELIASASFVGIATSDLELIGEAARMLAEADQRCHEFQLLFGSTGGLDRELIGAGAPVRIYVPYGESWYDYTLRRLPR